MKRRPHALFASVVLAFACTVPVRASDERLHVVVLHTNDIHGQVLPRKATWLKRDPVPMAGGLPRAAAYVNRVRQESAKNGDVVFVVDAGDWYQGTPEGLLDDGAGFVKALSLVGYDAMCVGNHDFDHGIPNLVKLLKSTGVPAVAANLEDKQSGKPVDWVPPFRIVERGGLRVAFVGLVTPVTPEITHPDAKTLTFVEPAQALTRAKQALTGKCDWIVPLTHLGADNDKALAKAHPDLDLIVGGHSHTFLKDGVREGTTLIVQTGSKLSCVGRADVWFDKATKKVVESKDQMIDLDEEPLAEHVDAPLAKLCDELIARNEARMKEVVGAMTASAERSKDPVASSTMGNLISDSLRAYALADVGLMNRGGIRADLPKGPITRRDVFEVMPFDNSVVVVKLTGAELEGMIRNAVEGKAHSGIEVSGLVIDVQVDASEKRKLLGIRIGGKPVDPARVYRVVMNSFMADGGDAYIEKVPPGDKRTDDVMLIRDVLEKLFVDKKQVTAPTDNRYVVTKS
jgi:5'-nucleotidase